MVLQAKALILGLLAAGTVAAVASSGGEAKASSSDKPKAPPKKAEKPADKSSKGQKTPSGVDPAHLADQTTDALLKQDIARTRELVKAWKDAGNPQTSAELSEILEDAVKGEKLPEWEGDGSKGSPLLRAFGDNVLLFENRGGKLLLWSDAWKDDLPILSAALKTKSHAIDADPVKGTTTEPVPDAATLQRIIATVEKGDVIALRKLADELEKAGFDEQAADLRAMADLIESGQAKPPDLGRPAPPPPPKASEPQFPKEEPLPEPRPKPAPKPAPKPGGSGRIVIVKKGEGPFQVTQRVLGKSEGGRFHELVAENIPPKKSDGKGGFTSLNPGDKLKVPASWPASKETQIGEVSAAPPAKPKPQIAPTPAPSSDRFVVVKKGEGPFQITQRIAKGRDFHELVHENIPPKKSDGKGGFTSLNPGERLKVPADWPNSPELVAGEADEILGADASPRAVDAGRLALNVTFGKLNPSELAAWQKREGIQASGKYDCASAYVLCFRYGIVPPVPHVFSGPQARKKFAGQMMAKARKDPERRDEFLSRARAAVGA